MTTKHADLPLNPALTAPLPRTDGGFKLIMADPPWEFRSYAANANHKSSRAIERHYRTMKKAEIMAMGAELKAAAASDAHLFLWATGPQLQAAFEVIRAWGFKYSGLAFTWVKLKRKHDARQLRILATAEGDLHVGLGFTTRKNAEFCLLARRGNARRVAKDVREIILSPVREHSRKPDEAYERARRYAEGPYLELFSREERDGWTTWGNQTGKF